MCSFSFVMEQCTAGDGGCNKGGEKCLTSYFRQKWAFWTIFCRISMSSDWIRFRSKNVTHRSGNLFLKWQILKSFLMGQHSQIENSRNGPAQIRNSRNGLAQIGNSRNGPAQIGNSRNGPAQIRNSWNGPAQNRNSRNGPALKSWIGLAHFGNSRFGLAHFRNSQYGLAHFRNSWFGLAHFGNSRFGAGPFKKTFEKMSFFWHVFHSYEYFFGF